MTEAWKFRSALSGHREDVAIYRLLDPKIVDDTARTVIFKRIGDLKQALSMMLLEPSDAAIKAAREILGEWNQ